MADAREGERMKEKRARKKRPWFMPGRGRRLVVRSRLSGLTGVAYVDDPQIWIEGVGVAGWYRRETISRDFLVSREKAER